MIPAWSGQAVRAAERPFLQAGEGPRLMARAAHGLAMKCLGVLRAERGSVPGARVVALIGTGNNGGDALWAAAALRDRGAAVDVVAVGNRWHTQGWEAARTSGARMLHVDELGVPETARTALNADLILDGVLGTGASGGTRGVFNELVAAINGGLEKLHSEEAPRPVVFAVDVVSGVEADTGALPGAVLSAQHSVTFGGTKVAHVLPPARGVCGTVTEVAIGIETELGVPDVIELAEADVQALWPRPTSTDHKYTRGVVGIVAGSPDYPGAALLCTRSAVAAGAGMVRYLGDDHTRSLVTLSTPEVVSSGQTPGDVHVQAWVAGPGAVDDEQGKRIQEIVDLGAPAVLDAGALEVVGRMLADGRMGPQQILTPHAGELEELLRWCQAWELVDEAPRRHVIEQAPGHWAQVAADATGATVLLKGGSTVVAHPGRGPLYVVANGSPWLATAGSGDCLAGIMGTLLALVEANPHRFEDLVRRWVRASSLSGVGAEALVADCTGAGRWAVVAAVAAAAHGRASTIAGVGPGPCAPEHIRAVFTQPSRDVTRIADHAFGIKQLA